MFKKNSNKAHKAKQQKPVFKQDYFNNCHRTYSCIHCRAHLANHDELISKLFQGNHGRAYLFNKVVNVGCKQAVQRELLTGLHAVADIYCDSCETTLGWKYEQAFVPSQKYKEGKYIIELVHMLKENDWDLTSYNTRQLFDEFVVSKSKQENQPITNGLKKNYREIEQDTFEKVTKDEYNNSLVLNDNTTTTNNASDMTINQPQNSNKRFTENSGSNNSDSSSRSKQIIQDQNETIKMTRNFINQNNIGEVDAARMNVEILSDGIELIERSLHRTHILENEDSNGYLSNSSKNSCYLSNSQSNVGSLDNSMEKTVEHTRSKKGCEDLEINKSSSNYTLTNDILEKENSSESK